MLEEVIALIVNEDECREVFYSDLPYGFHAEFRIFHTFDEFHDHLGASEVVGIIILNFHVVEVVVE